MVDFFLNGDIVGLFIKLFGVIAGILYLFFTIILIRQLDTMRKTLSINDGGILNIMAYIQAILAAFVVFYAFFVL